MSKKKAPDKPRVRPKGRTVRVGDQAPLEVLKAREASPDSKPESPKPAKDKDSNKDEKSK